MKTLWCLEMWGTKYPETQHHTPEQWIPNNEEMRKTTQSPRQAMVRNSSDCMLLPAKWVSKFSPNCIIAFQFSQPGSLPVLVSTILRVQLGVTKFLRNFGSDPCLTSAIQSDCWWLLMNKIYRLVINTDTVKNAVWGSILCTHVIIRAYEYEWIVGTVPRVPYEWAFSIRWIYNNNISSKEKKFVLRWITACCILFYACT